MRWGYALLGEPQHRRVTLLGKGQPLTQFTMSCLSKGKGHRETHRSQIIQDYLKAETEVKKFKLV